MPFSTLQFFNQLAKSSSRGILEYGSQKGLKLQKIIELEFGSTSALAFGAEMSPASSQKNALNWSSAASARLACAEVDAMLELKEAAHAVGINVIGNGRPSKPDRVRQHLAQCFAQPLEFVAGQTAGSTTWPDAGMKQALVSIYIAHARKEALVEQRCLDR